MNTKQEHDLIEIINLLHSKTGFDFALYKKNTLLRRIKRLKAENRLIDAAGYLKILQESPSEIEALVKELLNGVTSFFRDKGVWQILKETILPDLISKSANEEGLRFWVTACSTGEEAYSLAMLCIEIQDKTETDKKVPIQIFASDINEEAITAAQKGIYSANIAADVSPERLKRFFTLENDSFQVNSDLRDMITFAPHNILKDAPFTRLDLLSSRNLLIYFQPELQNRMLSLFHYSLNTDGVMLLGSAETTGSFGDGFNEIDSRLKIYKKNIDVVNSDLKNISAFYHNYLTSNRKIVKSNRTVKNLNCPANTVIHKHLDPALVIVNSSGDVLHITNAARFFFESEDNQTIENLFAVPKISLKLKLSKIISNVMLNFHPVIIKYIKIGRNANSQYIDILVQREDRSGELKCLIKIVFTEYLPAIENDTTHQISTSTMPKDLQKDLESELQQSRTELRTLQEKMVTTQEELNSTNEELQTVNIELQSRIDAFVLANDDMQNLLNSTEIATLFLDRQLNIRRYTTSLTSIIRLRESDIGRPFTDLATNLKYPEIEIHTKSVIKTLIVIESTISSNDGRWLKIRIMPYRTNANCVDGLVITFADVTVTQKLELQLKEANAVLRNSLTRL